MAVSIVTVFVESAKRKEVRALATVRRVDRLLVGQTSSRIEIKYRRISVPDQKSYTASKKKIVQREEKKKEQRRGLAAAFMRAALVAAGVKLDPLRPRGKSALGLDGAVRLRTREA